MNYTVRWTTAIIVLLCAIGGRPACGDSSMGMEVESVEARNELVSITTTGAEFILDRTRNVIICWQRIPRRRRVATIRSTPLNNVKLLSRDEHKCVFGPSQDNPLVTIGGDGVLRIALPAGADVEITGAYEPAWQGSDGNHFLLPDEIGGLGTYLIGNGKCRPPACWENGWTLGYQATSPSQLLISVFPPRPFDVEQSRKTIVHTFSSKRPYPSDEEIMQWSNIGPILTLHSWIWQGSGGSAYGTEWDESWSTKTFTPKDEKELRRVIATAHKHGMKVIPYTSPYYFGDSRGKVGVKTMPEYLETVRSLLAKYGFDGVYLDGLYQDDVEGSYEVVRGLRKMIGNDGIIYIHSTNMPLAKVSCPFIDTYATYTLRGEHTKWNKEYARWFVSNYNLGNSVGTLCYDSIPLNSEIIGLLFSVNARLPYWVQDGTWSKLQYYLEPDEVSLLNREYFPRLKSLSRP